MLGTCAVRGDWAGMDTRSSGHVPGALPNASVCQHPRPSQTKPSQVEETKHNIKRKKEKKHTR